MNGVLSNWTRDQYDADTSRVRSTSMKSLISPQGPRAYYLKHVDSQVAAREPEANDDYSPKVGPLVLGRLFHELVIDGKVGWFATRHRRGTQAWKVACKRNAGMVALSEKDDAMLWAWNDALLRNSEIKELMGKGKYGEQCITWDEPVTFKDADGVEHETSVPSKCAIDMLFHNGQFACLKTTRATNMEEEWPREIEKHNYLFSAAFYLRGIQSLDAFREVHFNEPMLHIVLCKSPPYYAYPKLLSMQSMMIGKGQVDVAFQRYARCMHDMDQGMDELAAWPDLEERKQSDPVTPSLRAMERHGQLAGEAI